VSRPRFILDLFALAAPLVNAMQFDAEGRFEINGNTVHVRPGQITTDPNVIAQALLLGLAFHIPGPIVIGAASGGFEGDTITIGGTPTAGDTVGATINGHALATAYTVVASDDQASVADAVARLINEDATDAAIVKADAVGNQIQITELAAGASHTVTAPVTGGHTTATVGTASTGGTGTAVVQGQEVVFTPGQVVSDPTMIGVVAQNKIPYTLQAGVAGYSGF
jgi:hypothetical protein